MKPEEAVERINEHITIHRYNEPHAKYIAEALRMGIDALEKQIPKKPNGIPFYNENLCALYCPSCEHYIGMWNSRIKRVEIYNISKGNICPYCGQAIDWTEVEE